MKYEELRSRLEQRRIDHHFEVDSLKSKAALVLIAILTGLVWWAYLSSMT